MRWRKAHRSVNNLKGYIMPHTMTERIDVAALVKMQKKVTTCYHCSRRHDVKPCEFSATSLKKTGHIAPVCKTSVLPPVDILVIKGRNLATDLISGRSQPVPSGWR